MPTRKPGRWWASGEPWIWLHACAVAVCLVAVLGLIGLIAARGLAYFWPAPVSAFLLSESGSEGLVVGERVEGETLSLQRYVEATGDEHNKALAGATAVSRVLVKTGNRRRLPPDFRWLWRHQILREEQPKDVWVLERTEWGNAYGWIEGLLDGDTALTLEGADLVQRVLDLTTVNHANRLQIARLRTEQWLPLARQLEEVSAVVDGSEHAQLVQQQTALEAQLQRLAKEIERFTLRMRLADGQVLSVPLAQVVRAWQPNQMSFVAKLRHFFTGVFAFLLEYPREGNTEGGIFPAIFGTVMMVLLMSLVVTPAGVIAALYLSEYARQGRFVRLIRIAVNNLAGVPSIVYGVFGLGFFVYVVGGSIDQLLFSDSLPAPTFGTPGLLWAALTLALLTLPVVIVSTEEGLRRVPRSLREASLALGATQFETLWRVILPIATPSILTGVILAVARAAGEVAPLMLVGVVKLAPSLPVDSVFPYLHLERKFMHLGFHIYDVGFQSPNVEASRPLVYATAFLLVAMIVTLNLSAVLLRSRLELRFRRLES